MSKGCDLRDDSSLFVSIFFWGGGIQPPDKITFSSISVQTVGPEPDYSAHETLSSESLIQV